MDDPLPYIIVESTILDEVEKKVNELIAQGYTPHPMAVAPSTPGATARPRYVVPMINLKIFTDLLNAKQAILDSAR